MLMAEIVVVNILGNRYKLTSNDNDAEQVRELAAQLDARLQETGKKFARVNPLNVVVLTALQLLEEGEQAKAEQKQAMEAMHRQYKDELQKLVRTNRQTVEELTSRHNAELEDLIASHATEVEQLNTEHASEVKQLVRDQAAEMQTLVARHNQELAKAKQVQQDLQTQVDKLQKDYDELMELLEEA